MLRNNKISESDKRFTDIFLNEMNFIQLNNEENTEVSSQIIAFSENIINDGVLFMPVFPFKKEFIESEYKRNKEKLLEALNNIKVSYSNSVMIQFNYLGGDYVKEFKELPTVEKNSVVVESVLWPSYSIEHFHAYYLNNTLTSATDAYLVPLVRHQSGEDFHQTYKNQRDDKTGVIRSFSSEFPVLTSVFSKDTDDYLGVFKVLPGNPRHSEKHQRCDIAIDFGTSNTNILFSLTDQHNVKFEMRTLDIDQHDYVIIVNDSLHTNELTNKFLPLNPVHMPFQTIFSRSENSDNNSPEPLMAGNIFFMAAATNAMSAALNYEEFMPFLVLNLKWGNQNSLTRTYAQLFLEQLCLMASFVALRKKSSEIHFHFSYPDAFSVDALNNYQMELKNIQANLKKKIKGNLLKSCSISCSESIAAVSYFNDPEVILSDTSVLIVDIGGGTSDIALFTVPENDQDYLYDALFFTSIKWAGVKILIEPFIQYFDVIQQGAGLGRDFDEITKNIKSENDPLKQVMLIEAFLHKLGPDSLNEVIQRLWLSKNDAVKPLFTQILFGLGGLFYYLGIIYKTHRILHPDKIHQNRPSQLFVAGNGARILRLLEQDRIENFLKTCFEHSFTPNKNISIKTTESVRKGGYPPKFEAVKGLIEKIDSRGFYINNRVPDPSKMPYIPGERISLSLVPENGTVGNEEKFQTLNREEFKFLQEKQLSLDNLKSYIGLFNGFYQKNTQFPVSLVSDKFLSPALNQLKNEIGAIRRHCAQTGLVGEIGDEPAIFIQGLRRFVDIWQKEANKS